MTVQTNKERYFTKQWIKLQILKTTYIGKKNSTYIF